MPLDKVSIAHAGERISQAQRILVTAHQRPDGDAIGSLLGLGLALQALGKQVQMVSVDGVPASLRHLEGCEQVRTRLEEPAADLVCVVDCSEFERAGASFQPGFIPDINIDHHITNLNFAHVNLIDTQAAATTQIIAGLLAAWGLPFTRPVAAALLTGLITDTIGFRTTSMTSDAMRLAARLMDMGVDLPELYRRALVERSFEATRYWGAGLSHLEREGRLVWTMLTLADRAACRYPGRDDADLVNVLAAVSETDVVIIFIEQTDQRVKVSWRSRPGFDVAQVALGFGGGGHAVASGAEISGSLQDVCAAVLSATRPLLNGKNAPKG